MYKNEKQERAILVYPLEDISNVQVEDKMSTEHQFVWSFKQKYKGDWRSIFFRVASEEDGKDWVEHMTLAVELSRIVQ
eukprot:CAMPEP_0168519568 /NCGR_PEP_ID=MMETSP0405-20121227/7401_1 /TAXON_ID=498012 /ORGANISM="Trichosphaerium sp, Strain Am-I-7 wt" /LENGTH=77 /DNA_ID=CAMNT_0008540147 /DNA_START=181 /DNA_END=414 /DNA_ORIENTATION=-